MSGELLGVGLDGIEIDVEGDLRRLSARVFDPAVEGLELTVMVARDLGADELDLALFLDDGLGTPACRCRRRGVGGGRGGGLRDFGRRFFIDLALATRTRESRARTRATNCKTSWKFSLSVGWRSTDLVVSRETGGCPGVLVGGGFLRGLTAAVMRSPRTSMSNGLRRIECTRAPSSWRSAAESPALTTITAGLAPWRCLRCWISP